MSDVMNRSNMSDVKINVKEILDLNFWTEELNLKADDLKDIIREVGPKVHDVRVYLAKKLLMAWPSSY